MDKPLIIIVLLMVIVFLVIIYTYDFPDSDILEENTISAYQKVNYSDDSKEPVSFHKPKKKTLMESICNRMEMMNDYSLEIYGTSCTRDIEEYGCVCYV